MKWNSTKKETDEEFFARMRKEEPERFNLIRLEVKIEHIKKLKNPTWEIDEAIEFAMTHNLKFDINIH